MLFRSDDEGKDLDLAYQKRPEEDRETGRRNICSQTTNDPQLTDALERAYRTCALEPIRPYRIDSLYLGPEISPRVLSSRAHLEDSALREKSASSKEIAVRAN